MALLHTPTTTDVDPPSFETDSEVVDVASCIGSLHRAPSTPAVLSNPPTLHEIGAEAEAEHEHELPDHEGYSPESSFTIIDKDGEAQEDSEVQRNDDSPPRLLRTLNRPAFAPTSGFTPTQLRSGWSPSRPPVRQRRAFWHPPTFRPPKHDLILGLHLRMKHHDRNKRRQKARICVVDTVKVLQNDRIRFRTRDFPHSCNH